METHRTEKIIRRLETHLRHTTRQLVKFETEEETLQYLSDSFRTELTADFVGIILKNDDQFSLKAWSGVAGSIKDSFPINMNHCHPDLMNKSLTHAGIDPSYDCTLTNILLNEKIPTWFTFPLKNELNLFGFCMIGYFQEVKLFAEMEMAFDEFGKDVAIAMLYQNEKKHKQKLHLILNYQQSLVKETVEGNELDGITNTLGKLLNKSVLLLDRFMRPISYSLLKEDEDLFDELVELATTKIIHRQSSKTWATPAQYIDRKIAVWPINGGGDLLGYLAVDVTNEIVDDYYRLGIDVARNIFSIQFIKQKLVFDTKEQVKDSFINKLLVEHISNEEMIIQYANLFNWDIFRPHSVAIVYVATSDDQTMNLLEQEANKSRLWEKLRAEISLHYPEMIVGHKEGEYILIAPVDNQNNKIYWASFYQKLKRWTDLENDEMQTFLAVGGKTTKLSDYYDSYYQAVKTLNVVVHRYKDIGFALFDELGAYTLLQGINDKQMVSTFIHKHLQPLLEYSEGKSMDLFHTLQVYLNHNGIIKDTAEELYIHRSTLLYRLEKIESLLDVDLNDSENRFNLMMAFKLFDLFDGNSSS